MIEAIVDRDEEWERSLVGKEQYIDRPIQPPGLLGSGEFETPISDETHLLQNMHN